MTLAPNRPIPIFPLPSVVLFPHARIPLHVYESRYRAMVRDALAADRLIALALLEPGWERDYQGSPPYHALACVGRIDEVEWLPNDCYDLTLVGLSRARLGPPLREYPYRVALAEWDADGPIADDDPLAQMERAHLLAARSRLLPAAAEAWVAPPRVEADAPFAVLVNTLAFALRVEPSAKLAWLELDSVLDRARAVGEAMRRMKHASRGEEGPGN